MTLDEWISVVLGTPNWGIGRGLTREMKAIGVKRFIHPKTFENFKERWVRGEPPFPRPLTKAERKTLWEIAKSGFVGVTLEGAVYLEGNTQIDRASVKRLLRRGLIAPSADGLLADCPQSYTLTETGKRCAT